MNTLKRIRVRFGLRQKDAAAILGISQNLISCIEGRVNEPNFMYVRVLVGHFLNAGALSLQDLGFLFDEPDGQSRGCEAHKDL